MRTLLGHIVSHPAFAGVCILFTFLRGPYGWGDELWVWERIGQ